ncbi:hypothetical protein LOZ65_002150 [Ophidiomyces ophidiicola]|nr:hypothetical protein LOZ65_002150 [Ophidiomyces ophidiicola]
MWASLTFLLVCHFLLSHIAAQPQLPEASPLHLTMKEHPPLPIRVLTHNIRYASSGVFQGERPWQLRRVPIINLFHVETLYNPESFICLQEVLHGQLDDIDAGLRMRGGTWAFIGVGRDDGKKAGEYSPIFYRPTVWELEKWETVWLSETPKVPSKGWDAASIRIVTIGVFRHRQSRKGVLAMCTHLDDQGSTSRRESAKLILKKVDEYLTGEFKDRISGVFLAGDFNSEVNQEAYQTLVGTTSPFVDTREQVEHYFHYGNEITYTGFGDEEKPSRIDYILVGPRNKGGTPWTMEAYGVLPNKFDDGLISSDHRLVVADGILK